ncbi:MAG: hypothetical protein JSV20_04205, partial [Candidatus Bathyarchaeota archaeon]
VIRATKKRLIEAHPPLESPVSTSLESPVSVVLDDSHLEESVTTENDFSEIFKLLEHAYERSHELDGNDKKSALDRENDPKPQSKHHRKYY